jgi:Flp pilus assembly protein TadG
MAHEPAVRRRHARRVLRDERGMSFIFISVGFMAFLAASVLAIDVGMLMTARSQAQNAADAGALAGATALVFNSFTDQTASGPAVTSAISAAQANPVAGQSPSVLPADVTFPGDPVTGRSDIVQVSAYRTAARSNPIPTLIAQLFGTTSVDVSATARAAAMPANVEDCVLPFTIPDKWIEKQCATEICPWDPSDTFEMYQTQGNQQNTGAPLAQPDIYIPPGTKNATPTGFDPVADKGVQMVLKPNNQNKIAPSMYNPWDLPGSVGGNDFSNNIAGCNPNRVPLGLTMTPENGNMVGPTQQGTQGLVATDPHAYWDTTCNCVKGSEYSTSPRIRVVPLYDPSVYASGQQTGKSGPQLQVVNYLGFFIEDVNGSGNITGRITPITGKFDPNAPPAVGGFAQAIMLVK